MPTVKPQKSETIWFNVLLIASSVGTALVADENFKALVGDNIGIIGSIVGIIGFILRLTTTKPISIKPEKPPSKPSTHRSRLDMLKPDDEFGV